MHCGNGRRGDELGYICDLCAAVLGFDDDDAGAELDDDGLADDAEPLTAPKGWGPPPMGSAKRPRPSEVKPERSEP